MINTLINFTYLLGIFFKMSYYYIFTKLCGTSLPWEQV